MFLVENSIGKRSLKYDGSHWYVSVPCSDAVSCVEKERLGFVQSALIVAVEHGLASDVESAQKAVKDSIIWLWGEQGYEENRLTVDKVIQEYFYPTDENQRSREAHPLREYLKEVLETVLIESDPSCRSKVEKLVADYLLRDGILLKDNENVRLELQKVISNYYCALKVRRERFKQRAITNGYNYFVTFTRDDKKIETFEEFETKLKNTLKNLKQRYGWKYQGTFEWSEKGRLHAHLLVSIPDGTLPGKLTAVKRFNEKKKRMTENLESDYFRERIGVNDFVPLSKKELMNGRTVEYILKYITKSTDQIYYCRGLTESVEIDVDEYEIATVLYYKNCARYYFFDSDFDEEERKIENNNNLDYFAEAKRFMLKQASSL